MSRKLFPILALLIGLTFLVAACQPAAPETVVETVIVEKEGEKSRRNRCGYGRSRS